VRSGPRRRRASSRSAHAIIATMHRVPLLLGVCIALVLMARSGLSAAAENAAPRHHRDGGFQNNHVDFEPKGLGALLQWRIDALRDGLPRPPRTPTPVVGADLAYLRSNAAARLAMEPAITWIGHATLLVQAGGANILTDPIFSLRASPVAFIGPKRHVDPGIALGDLPHIDAVVISHNHYDHLDDASVQALAAQAGGSPVFIVPLGLKAWFARRGIERVVELDWWQSHTVGAVEVVLTPVQHWSGRSLTDRMATLWGGYALFAPDFHVFFAGDTAYSKDFVDIRARFATRQGAANGGGFDVALLPIGAYEPRWFMQPQHADPAEAVQIHLDLDAKQSIGMHWGTFELTDESLDQPPIDLAAARHSRGIADAAFSVLAIGETRRFARRAR